MMKISVALFDFDGVVMDTESQYSIFWHKIGVDVLNIDDLEIKIKGTTLTDIYEKYFKNMTDLQNKITNDLNLFEENMNYNYVPGFLPFISDLKNNGIKVGIVTSSNRKKMDAVFSVHPELRLYFDLVLTSEYFSHSKPHPECYIKGMQMLGSSPENTLIFEDSFNGLLSAKNSGGYVIGLTTTNGRTSIEPYCHLVVDDFQGLTYNNLL